MNTFYLQTEPALQGAFTRKKKNVAFIFQVNCPGCFVYGIPIFNVLYEHYQDEVGFIGISTAFEDFEWNTQPHTQQLLDSGETVGETRNYLLKTTGTGIYQKKIHFPVAFDRLVPAADFLTDNNLALIFRESPAYQAADEETQGLIRTELSSYYNRLEFIASTFTLNQLKGTPSFVVFDEENQVLGSFFGREGYAELEALIQE